MEETREQHDETRGEWLRFGVLVGVLLGAILVVWAVRPFVTSRVVPAFLGDWGGHQVSLPILETGEAPVQEESGTGGVVVEEETAVESEATPSEIMPNDTADDEGASSDTATNSAGYPAPATEEQSEEQAPISEITHTVQPGDTLFRIAQQYNVTIEQIVMANKITNPNQIAIGDTLKIPQP